MAEQLGHASIRVTKDVNGNLIPSSRVKAAGSMSTVLSEDDDRSSTGATIGLAVIVRRPAIWRKFVVK